MSSIRKTLFAAALLSIAPVVSGQSATAHKIEITLTDEDCAKATEVFVVAGNDDRTRLRATRDPVDPCRWHAELDEPFPITRTRFSLRLRGKRTGCRYAIEVPDKTNVLESAGRLRFAYPTNPARDLTIAADPTTFTLSYVRVLPADKNDPGSVECREGADWTGSAPLTDVLLNGETIAETLYLKIGLTAKEPDAQWVMFDGALRQMISPNAEKKRSTKLGPDVLGAAVVREIARQQTDAPPYVSGNEAEAFAAGLRKKKFKNVRIKVE